MKLNTDKINVLNYNENVVSATVAPGKSYTFEASFDGEIPTVVPMTYDELLYLNNTGAFKTGLLTFEDNKKAEIYNALGINDWENILTNKEIKNIILSPTYDGLVKIVNIKDSSVFERVRAVYHKLRVEDRDISTRVAQIVEERYKELKFKKANSSIVITKRDIPQNNSDEVDALKAQLEDMKRKMAELMEASKSQTSVADAKPAKKPGRPAKKTIS